MTKRPVMFKGEIVHGYYATKCGRFFGPKGELTAYYPSERDTNPYPKVYIGSKFKKRSCHTVMAHTFIPHPVPERPKGFKNLPEEWKEYVLTSEKKYALELQVDHIDSDKNNWKVSNLRWATAKENQQHYQKKRQASAIKAANDSPFEDEHMLDWLHSA